MTCDPKDLRLHTPCEICKTEPAIEMKGGINFITQSRGFWFVCLECKQRIIDERKGYRRQEETR